MKKLIKQLILKTLRRLGDLKPIQISWKDFDDHALISDILCTMRLAKIYQPKEVAVPSNQKVLILAPHPDDETIGCGGTILKMVEQGCDVHVLHFTLGDEDEVYEESLRVPEFLQFTPHYLKFTVDQMQMDETSLKAVADHITNIAPHVIFIPFLLDDNDDHRRVNEYLDKLITQKRVQLPSATPIWAYQVYSFFPINAVVKVTEHIETKSEAMRCYTSQFQVRDWVHFMKGLNAFNIRFLTGGHIGEEYVEVFYTDTLKNYMQLCRSYFGEDARKCYTNPRYQQ